MTKSILIVDDESVVTEISKRQLQSQGYTVEVASNGEEALRVLQRFSPELILLDIQMPKMNGYTFMIEKGKQPGLEKIPVIVITAYGEMEPIFRRHHINDYLLKPFQLDDLIQKVETTIGPGEQI